MVVIINIPLAEHIGDYPVRLVASLDDGTQTIEEFLVTVADCVPDQFVLPELDDQQLTIGDSKIFIDLPISHYPCEEIHTLTLTAIDSNSGDLPSFISLN